MCYVGSLAVHSYFEFIPVYNVQTKFITIFNNANFKSYKCITVILFCVGETSGKD